MPRTDESGTEINSKHFVLKNMKNRFSFNFDADFDKLKLPFLQNSN